MQTVLVIDDDPKLANLLAEFLGSRGLQVITENSGSSGLSRMRSGGVDAIVLDVMMPGMDGFVVLQEIRKESTIPVIMLTARGDDMDRIVGLEMGADDYLSKPFNPRELLARIRAVLRRTQQGNLSPAVDDTISACGISLSPSRREVKVDEVLLDLTTTEFEILRVLLAGAGRVIPRERLMEQARGEEWAAYDRSIDVHISHLRKKIGDDPRKPKRIKTIRGVGYLVPD